MIVEKARAGPPLVMMARHWKSGSTAAVGQSLKSGNVDGGSKPARFCDLSFSVGAVARHAAAVVDLFAGLERQRAGGGLRGGGAGGGGRDDQDREERWDAHSAPIV